MVDADQLVDGETDFSRGQDASKEPYLVSPNGYYAGINVSTQKGSISPRFAFKERKLKFPKGGVTLPSLHIKSYEDIFYTGKYQAVIPYPIASEHYFIIIISGILFQVNIDSYEVLIIPIANDPGLNEYAMRINWSVAGRFINIFDYPARPVILEDGTARRSDHAKYEVPISRIGTSNQNRLFIANGGDEFTAGDPEGNPLTPDAPITFEEVLAPAAPYINQFFRLSTNFNNNPITAMGFFQQVDISTEIGTMFVATNKSIWTYKTNTPRSQWEAGVFGSIFVPDSGIAGPRAFINVNSDLFWLDSECQLRSASVSRDEQGKWSKVPISKEVENWLKCYDATSVEYSVLNYFKNNIFVTANPFNCVATTINNLPILDIAFGGFVVLDAANVATLVAGAPNSDRTPAWDGLWTGVRPLDTCTIDKRMFVISKDYGTVNKLYEVDPTDTVDFIDGKERYIETVVYTKDYDFRDQFLDKQLQTVEFALGNLRGDFSLDVKYKPSQSPYFLPWNHFEFKAPYRVCGTVKDCQFKGLLPQTLKEVILGASDEALCDPVTNIYYDYFRQVQLKLKIKGKSWKLGAFKLLATPKEKPIYASTCNDFNVVNFCRECDQDWKIPDIDLCLPATT